MAAGGGAARLGSAVALRLVRTARSFAARLSAVHGSVTRRAAISFSSTADQRGGVGGAGGPEPVSACASGRAPDWAPAPGSSALRQPDGTTCGTCALLVARMILDPDRRASLSGGGDTVLADPFRREVLDLHRRTNGWRRNGGWQWPWPRSLGTTPWALARALDRSGDRAAVPAGYPPVRHRVRAVDPRQPRAALDTAAGAGRPVPLFMGSAWLPRHVVLITGAAEGVLDVYDPAAGHWRGVAVADLADGRARIAGWSQPLFVVVPTNRTALFTAGNCAPTPSSAAPTSASASAGVVDPAVDPA